MGKPTATNARCVIRHEGFSLWLARVGKGPLCQLWIHEDGNGGRGMIVDVPQSDEFIGAWQDLLDEIDNESDPR